MARRRTRRNQRTIVTDRARSPVPRERDLADPSVTTGDVLWMLGAVLAVLGVAYVASRPPQQP